MSPNARTVPGDMEVRLTAQIDAASPSDARHEWHFLSRDAFRRTTSRSANQRSSVAGDQAD
jgi:hypothetical protein